MKALALLMHIVHFPNISRRHIALKHMAQNPDKYVNISFLHAIFYIYILLLYFENIGVGNFSHSSIMMNFIQYLFFFISKLRNILTKKGQALVYTRNIQRKEKQKRDQ